MGTATRVTRQLNVSIDEELYQRLRRHAYETGEQNQQIVSRLLAAEFERIDAPTAEAVTVDLLTGLEPVLATMQDLVELLREDRKRAEPSRRVS